MNARTRPGLLILLAGMLLAPAAYAQQTATLSGTVTDAQDGTPLAGANVALLQQGAAGFAAGAASDPDGRFQLPGLQPGDYTLRVSFVGFQQQELPVSLTAGDQRSVEVALQPTGFNLNAVVVTASRRAEKVLDAPASVSVIDLQQIEQNPAPSADALLKNTTGIDYAQTGVDRSEVVLRGFNNAFSGATYVLTDYRQAAVPSLGVNVFSIMPAQSIDLEQVEVVRGPGSALYGAGVDAGVVHFFSKDPFTYPGTTVSVTGGERSMFAGALRHAGVVGQRWGYKITGNYARADDWRLNPSDPQDQQQLDGDADTVERNYDYDKYNVNGLLQYRFDEATTLSVGGGTSSLTAIVLSGIGTLQGEGFGYSYGQARLQAGGFFAQAYYNKNSAGDSFVYGTGQKVVDESSQFNAQAQYSFVLAQGRHEVIVGADFEQTTPDTDETIYGRNEEDAQITELGGYAQASLSVSPQLDVVLATRGDYNNVVEAFQLSPRAALVYKPSAAHSLRASYNRAFSSPGNNSLFLDIAAQRIGFGEGIPFEIIFQGRGAVDGFTFEDYRQTQAARFSLPVPGLFNQPVPVNAIPLQAVYGVAAAQLAQTLNDPNAPLPPPLDGLPQEVRAALAVRLGQLTPFVQGTTAGTLGIPDNSEQGYRTVEGPVDIDPLKQTTSQTFELGYKGLVAGRVLIAVDGYYATKKDFVGPLLVESPLVYLTNLGGDLTTSLAPVLTAAAQQDPQFAGLLASLNLTPAQAAGLVSQLIASGFASTPAAIVQPDQPVLPADAPPTQVGGFLAYRNFGSIQYWGVDASVRVLATERLNFFGNLSVVSDDFFDNEELDEANTTLALALNAPTLKLKGGFDFAVPQGVSFNAAGRYVKGFPVRSGPYVGEVDDYFLMDVGAGYDFGRYAPGLRVDVLGQNVLDNMHREFVGAPELGRMLIARATYSF